MKTLGTDGWIVCEVSIADSKDLQFVYSHDIGKVSDDLIIDRHGERGARDRSGHRERRSRTSEVGWKWNYRLVAPPLAVHLVIDNDDFSLVPARIDVERQVGIVGDQVKTFRV